MAEAYMRKFGGDKFEAESAGIEPGKLNPLAIEVMKEDGIDISQNQTNSAFEFFKSGKTFYYVVTVCDPKTAEQCPIFPHVYMVINWNLDDPSTFTGSPENKLEETRKVRDQIKSLVIDFIKHPPIKI